MMQDVTNIKSNTYTFLIIKEGYWNKHLELVQKKDDIKWIDAYCTYLPK